MSMIVEIVEFSHNVTIFKADLLRLDEFLFKVDLLTAVAPTVNTLDERNGIIEDEAEPSDKEAGFLDWPEQGRLRYVKVVDEDPHPGVMGLQLVADEDPIIGAVLFFRAAEERCPGELSQANVSY